TSATGGGPSDCAGRYGLRRPGRPRCVPEPRLLVDRPVQPRARLGGSEREPAEGAVAPEGLVALVTADSQGCSGSRGLRRLPASVTTSDRAESESSDVLRPQGKTTGPFGWRGPARLFDNREASQDGHGRRREDPDDERPASCRARRDRVVLAA